MKITCDVIEDLLPLYVDDVASEDSRTLIEEHLRECENCKRTLRQMKETDGLSMDEELICEKEDKTIILHLKKKMLKRIGWIAAVSSLIVILVCAGNYLYYDYKVYVDYADAGIHVENDRVYGFDTGGICQRFSPDQMEEFIYLKKNPFRKNENEREEQVIQNLVLIMPSDVDAVISDEKEAARLREEGVTNFVVMSENPTPEGIKKIYYLGRKQEKILDDAWDAAEQGDSEMAEQLMREVKRNSVLLWEKK